MKKYLKTICILLAAVTVLGLSAGCAFIPGGRSSSESRSSSPAGSSSSQSTPAPSSDSSSSSAPEPSAQKYVLEEETLVDNDALSFRVTKAEENSIYGFVLKVFAENKTSDKTILITVPSCKINGYNNDAVFYEEVAHGKKINSEIHFSDELFGKSGITAEEVVFTLRASDYDDWLADPYAEETFSLYPTGKTAETVVYPERRTAPGEKTIVDNEDFTFIILDTGHDNIWGHEINCYIENKKDYPVMVSWNDVSVNGFMIDPFWADELSPESRAYASINFDDEDLEENGINSIEEIEFRLKAYNSDDIFAPSLVDETFTWQP